MDGDPADPVAPLGEPVAELPWLEPFPDEALGPEATAEQRERVELAFVAALQHLPPNQRAALLLRDVLALSARETRGCDADDRGLGHQRAAARADARRGADAGREPAGHAARARRRAAAAHRRAQYTSALERGDVDAMVELLAEDVTWSMPPWREWYRGVADVRAFLADKPMSQAWRHLPAHANGQLAVGCYMRDDDGVYGASRDRRHRAPR